MHRKPLIQSLDDDKHSVNGEGGSYSHRDWYLHQHPMAILSLHRAAVPSTMASMDGMEARWPPICLQEVESTRLSSVEVPHGTTPPNQHSCLYSSSLNDLYALLLSIPSRLLHCVICIVPPVVSVVDVICLWLVLILQGATGIVHCLLNKQEEKMT